MIINLLQTLLLLLLQPFDQSIHTINHLLTTVNQTSFETMAMHASRLTQDQNLNVHFDGVKINGFIAQKNKGGLGGRKALNDISNSGKPAALQPSRKHNAKNVIPIGEDSVVSKKAANPVSGRKALGDLTNSAIPSSQKQGLRKISQRKQAIAFKDDEKLPYSIAEEGFLHNHDECIKAQNKSMGLNEFLMTIGLDEDACLQSVSSACNNPPKKSKDENSMMIFEMEEMLEPIIEDRPYGGLASPICGSPVSPRLSCLRDYDDFPSFFVLAESP